MDNSKIKKLLADKLPHIDFDSILEDKDKREALEYLASLVEEKKFKEIRSRKLAAIEKELKSVKKSQKIFMIPQGEGIEDPLSNELKNLFSE